MRRISSLVLLFFVLHTAAQNRIFLDGKFDTIPDINQKAPSYVQYVEQKEGKWTLQRAYYPEMIVHSVTMVTDSSGKIKHGAYEAYNKYDGTFTFGRYVRNVKQGMWYRSYKDDILKDSTFYKDGFKKGVVLTYDEGKRVIDSAVYDGAGKGTISSWFESGKIKSKGMQSDNGVYEGDWTFYHENGTIRATVQFNDGEVLQSTCFSEGGKQLPAEECVNRTSYFKGGDKAWATFISRNLNADVPARKRAPAGRYRVIIEFIVDKTGKPEHFKAVSNMGYGMEEEAIRTLKKMPNWEPASFFGLKQRSYKVQPITFVVD